MVKTRFYLALAVLLMVMSSLSVVDALKWDNKEKFNKSVGQYGKYEIYDSAVLGIGYGKRLIDIELVNNTDLCLDKCFAIKEIELYEQDESLIDDIRFFTKQKDDSWVEQPIRNYQIYVAKRQGKNQVDNWQPYTLGTTMKKGSYFVKLEGEKKEERTVDWQVQSQGIWTTNWAVWNFNWDAWINRTYGNRTSYPDLNLTSGTTSLGGNLTYNNVYIGAGATLQVNGTGYLNIIAYNVTVLGTIDGNSRSSYTGGSLGTGGGSPCGSGVAGGTASGGGSGGAGGVSPSGTCASASGGSGASIQGTSTGRFELLLQGRGGGGGGGGSGGSACCDYAQGSNGAGGSNGGAVIRIDSPYLKVSGNLYARGGNGGNGGSGYDGGYSGCGSNADTCGGGGGGGGSGGQVILDGILVNLNSSTIHTYGGSGGSGGSGGEGSGVIAQSGSAGAGGRYKVFYAQLSNSSQSINLGSGGTSYLSQQQITGVVNLITPTNNSIVASTNITFTANATVLGGANITNVSLWTTNGGVWKAEETRVLIAQQNFSYDIFYLNLSDTQIQWNYRYCDTDGDCGFAQQNNTLNIDVGSPTINILEPVGKQNFGTSNLSKVLNVTVLDSNLDRCWYQYLNVNTTFNCSQSTNFSLGGLDDTSLRVWANDTLGNLGYQDTNWTYFLWQDGAVGYDQFSGELDDSTFTIKVILPEGDAIQSASFYYNNTQYSPDISLLGNTASLSQTITTPEVVTTTNFPFYWQFSINPLINTSTLNQTVIGTAMDNCSNFTNLVFNFTLVDENTEAKIVGANSSIEVDLILYTLGGSTILTYSNTYTNTPYAPVCLQQLLNTTSYRVDATAGYVANGYAQEFWYLDDGLLSYNSSSYDNYTLKNVTLRALPLVDSTTFLFRYYDEYYSLHFGSVVQVLRNYIGQGEYKEVERCLTDRNGECHLHLIEEDAIYRFRIIETGAEEFLSGEYNAKCLETPCQIKLRKDAEVQNWDDELDNLEEGTYSVSTDKETREVTVAFNLASTGTMQVDVYEYNQNASADTLVATDTVVAKTGVATATVPLAYGNKTYYAVVRHDSSFVSSQWVDLNESGFKYFGNLGLFLAGLLVITLGLIAVSHGAWTVAFLILGMIVASVTQLVDMGFYLLMWIISAGALIVWKLSTRRSI